MKKNIIIIISILLLVIGGGIAYYFLSGKNTFSNPASNIKKSNEIKEVVNIDKATEKVFLDKEIQLKIDLFNKSLKPNYLKVYNYSDSDHLLTYKDTNVTWYIMPVKYDINNKALADYDIHINKGSLSELDYKKKGKLYKENLERKMKNIYYKSHGYDRLVKTGIIGYITKDEGIYTMHTLGDYINDTFSNKAKNNIELSAKLGILKDYFNYMPIYFDKNPDEIKEILEEAKKEMKDKKFADFAKVLDKIYFTTKK